MAETANRERIILFGSAARGEMHEEGDLDLLVERRGSDATPNDAGRVPAGRQDVDEVVVSESGVDHDLLVASFLTRRSTMSITSTIDARTARAFATALAIVWCVCHGCIHVATAQERLREHEFALRSGRLSSPNRIWSDGTTMWVADGDRLFPYDLVTKKEAVGKLFDLKHWDRGSALVARDLWSDGTTMWVLIGATRPIGGPMLLAYDVATQAPAPAEEFYLEETYGGILRSDGTTMWLWGVGSDSSIQLYAYDMVTKMRAPDREFELELELSSLRIWDSWSDGRTMWVLTCRLSGYECSSYKLYAYDLVARARAPDKDFDIPTVAWNSRWTSIWSDGRTMWILNCWYLLDCSSARLYAYDTEAKVRTPDRDFMNLIQSTANNPGGFWSDGSTMWVANTPDDGVLYAYDMATRVRKPDEDIDTPRTAGNIRPSGVWSDGSTMWVVDNDDRRVYAYDLATKARKPNEEFTIEGYYAIGIWSDGSTVWVAGGERICDLKLYAYDMPTKARRPDKDLSAAENCGMAGIWSDGSTMWVGDRRDHKIHAYDMATGARDPDRDFDVPQLRTNPNGGVREWSESYGIWSDGSTMWVAGWPEDLRFDRTNLFPYDMTTRVRVPDKELFTFAKDGTGVPGPAWSDGSTMWVVDHRVARLYAYDVIARARVPGKDFKTLNAAGNSLPAGIWSDGVTMWVTDVLDDKIYAYDMATRVRVPDRDFDTLRAAGHTEPRGIWSDGVTMWVVNWRNYRLYAYDMATKAHTADRDIDLSAAETYLARDLWSDGETVWVGGGVGGGTGPVCL